MTQMPLGFLRSVLISVALLLTGCGFMSPSVQIASQPTVRPVAAQTAAPEPPKPGAIYASSNFRPMFENRRARHPGDILLIKIAEKTTASQSSNSSVSKSGALNGSISALPFISAGDLAKTTLGGNSQNQFEGQGETGSDNVFSGDITVTVIEVLGNGNLHVAGEKQIGLNGNVDVLRFSGIVSPDSISPENEVLSSKVADARLDFRGRGQNGEAQVMGWLSRFFLNFLPL
ncbi:MAG: flagellar basal body L-ring protein FlgH [Burkholderiaceae bacterium]